MARNIAENDLLPGVIERDESGVFPEDIFHEKIGKFGFVGLPYPKEYGG
jgi:butyryl-CoA dehydrogenase